MKGDHNRLLYIGKAANVHRRVKSYFDRPHEYRIQKLVSEIRSIDYRQTDTAIEALILEAKLIKEYQPPFNVLEKDGKSFLYLEITRDKFPRILLVRGKDPVIGHRFGPFTSALSIREAYKMIRKIFPFSIHEPEKVGKYSRPCFDAEVGLCPGVCTGAISQKEYARVVRKITLFFEGKKMRILTLLEREMRRASRALQFEAAEVFRRQMFALRHIQDIAFIREDDIDTPKDLLMDGIVPSVPRRIEGYDISNISGTSSVGSMVVFTDGKPDKQSYRKFKIKTISGPNDTGMLKEVLTRRLRNRWPLPQLMLIDGGVGQVMAARMILKQFRLPIPVVGIAKGPERKRNDLIGILPPGVPVELLIQIRDEAHRFAIKYHKALRRVSFLH
jgi:excinuclease ABC subunit C